MKDQELRDLFRELLNCIGDRLDRVERNIIDRTEPKKQTPTPEEINAELRAFAEGWHPNKQWPSWLLILTAFIAAAAIFAAGAAVGGILVKLLWPSAL